MANVEQRLTQGMVQEHCFCCGVEFWFPRVLHDTARGNSSHSFYCPNGHRQVYKESEADRLRRERDRLSQRLAQKDDELAAKEREIAAHKGQVTKLKRRAAAGTCPCCQRTFQNMAIHMRKQHPEFKPELKVAS